MLLRLQKALRSSIDEGISSGISRDTSVYTGASGVACAFLRISQPEGNQEFLHYARVLEEQATSGHRPRASTFLCGDVGIYTTSALVNHALGNTAKRDAAIAHVLSAASRTIEDCELLYGRSGYLYSALLLNKSLGREVIPRATLLEIAESILMDGKEFSEENDHESPLMWEWHGSTYLGAAHGVAGILRTLFEFPELVHSSTWKSHILGTIDHLLSIQFPSGNWPSSGESQSGDRLVQWCHGAPGFVPFLCKAYEMYADPRYLKSCERACECVKTRGHLHKGRGLCHGVSGNAYTFLYMWRQLSALSAEKKAGLAHDASYYLECALEFAEFETDPENIATMRIPDNPYSLFEGLAGTLCFYHDLVNILRSGCTDTSSFCFPGFDLNLIPR